MAKHIRHVHVWSALPSLAAAPNAASEICSQLCCRPALGVLRHSGEL